MKFRTFMIAAALGCVAAATGFAQLSMAKADWAQGPVQYLMTKEEVAQWKALKSDADADQFIALFWARRDPTPGTPQNEFQQNFEGRVQYADQHFGIGRQRGSLTDRGKVLIVFGPPTQPVRNIGGMNQPQGVPGTTTEEESTTVTKEQVWIYDGQRAESAFGAARMEVHFVDRLGNGDYRLQTPTTAAQERVVEALITQPNLTTVPTYTQQRPQPAPAAAQPVAPAAPVTALKTAALETAVSEAKAAKPSDKAMISFAEFMAPTGEPYVSAGIYAPGIAADAADTIFGAVDDSTGKRVLAFEEPATPTVSKGNLFAAKTLELPDGAYSVTIGLAKAGAPVVVTSAPLEVSPLAKDAVGTSIMLLSNDVQMMSTAAPVKTPFAFGQLRIVPKADLKFTNKDDLNYFVEIHNPGIDSTTNAPKMQMKLELLDSKGKTVAGAPLSDVQLAPLSGQPGKGEYAIVNGIPLAQMSKPLAPGEYTLKMRILDIVTKQSYNLEQKFRISP